MWCKKFITHIILVAAKGLWHLGSLFYHDTQFSQLGWFTNLLWCDILLNKATWTGPTTHLAHIYTVPFLWPWKEHRWQHRWVDDFTGQCLLWRLLSWKTFYDSKSVSVSRISLTASSSLTFFPSQCNRHLQWSALFTLLCMTQHSCSNLMPLRYEHLLQWQQNRSKGAMWLMYKIPAIRGCPRCF